MEFRGQVRLPLRRVEAFDSLVGSGTALSYSSFVTLYTSLESQAKIEGTFEKYLPNMQIFRMLFFEVYIKI